ncbi:SOS response-associated peptidase [Paenibacillus barcinonensis]|uniref:Abasic site processing protein n=1 Tax=Paenibacillus barcinonensis TaxID=198119 RepID=A0A2V4VRR0_PAEBA|nr:SOS response-associated peptidase [Paenibacillus barcinonensis]PYE49280.1 putative SOS response-associated peptidase YedK [Paenibacillus barcinonensis]QKS55501.1 SOS response-associated peptidase [Paenibacillus barcinonensis]
MCGRFTITDSLNEIMERYMASIADGFEYRPNYNAAPMQYIPTIIAGKDGNNKLGALRWGLVPSWAKDDKIGSKMINARAETLTEKPAFKRLISSKRCIIPTNGFYEWKKEGSNKRPMRILMKDDSIFSLAGLYDTWTDQDGNKLSTCTIITTEPNELMEDIHNRMPVILHPDDEAEWLGRDNNDVQSLLSLLKPYNAFEMRAYEVPKEVGNVRNNNEELLKEIG